MRILIDLRPLHYNFFSEETNWFITTSLDFFLKENPENEYFFLTGRPVSEKTLPILHTKKMIIKKSLPGRLGWMIWYDWQVPGLIKKMKADILITTGGITSSCNIPQCTWMPELAGKIKDSKTRSYFSFYKKRIHKTLQQAQTIFIFSAENKKKMLLQYNIPADKLSVMYTAPEPAYDPVGWTEKENVKIKYTGGREYFLAAGPAGKEDLIHLLKAFSQFKKRQQSNMQLVVAVKGISNDLEFIEKLENYKYRSDVFMCNHLAKGEMVKLVSSAYALIYPVNESGPGTLILNAFKASVPVITTNKACPREITADAVLYAATTDHESLAGHLMLLYKDESLRNQFIEKGKEQVRLFSWQRTGMQLKNGILKM